MAISPDQSLLDLTARTATADSDLIHVNSGGTDYKETKQDFLQGDFNHTFATDTNLTAQADALPVGSWFGSCSAYGHQSATGAPVNSFGVIAVRKGSSTNCVLDYYVPSSGDVYRKGRTANGWDANWTQQPTRSEINSLNNSLTKSYPTISKHANVTNDAIYVTKIGYIVYVSGYFKVSASIGSGQHLITFTGLTTGFQLQYLFIHNGDNQVSARLETSANGSNPSLKVSTQISGTLYHYINAVLVCI